MICSQLKVLSRKYDSWELLQFYSEENYKVTDI